MVEPVRSDASTALKGLLVRENRLRILVAAGSGVTPSAGPIAHLSFEDWIHFIFDHRPDGPEWYAEVDAPYWNAPAALTAEYVTRLFSDPCPPLEGFTDAELNKGLWYMISPGLGEHMLCLDEPSLEIATREAVVRSCESLFRKLFLPRCSPHLSHCDWVGAAPLNSICYMWWDVMPVYGGPKAQDQAALHRAALETIEAIIGMDSMACQESALHGLGHWHYQYPAETEAIVDRFLASHEHLPEKLRVYAGSARCGCIL
jgi:hypothetical protein